MLNQEEKTQFKDSLMLLVLANYKRKAKNGGSLNGLDINEE